MNHYKNFLISFLLLFSIGGVSGSAYAQKGNLKSADSIFIFISMASDSDSVRILIPSDFVFNIQDTVRLDSPLELKELTSSDFTPTSGHGMLFVKSSDSELYFLTAGGVESMLTAGSGEWNDHGTFLKPIDDADVAIHLSDSADNDSLIIGIDTSGNVSFTTTTGTFDFAGGNVGIGTTSPDVQFQVENSGDAIIAITSGASSVSEIDMGDVNDINIGALKYHHAGDSLEILTNNVVRMTIDSAGDVGIGTSNPTSNLHIFQDSPSSNQVLFSVGTSDDAVRFKVDEDGDIALDGGIDGASRLTMRITQDNAVGGLASSTFRFETNGSNTELTDDNDVQGFFYIAPRVNQSGSASFIGFAMDVIENDAVASGQDYLMDLRLLGVSKFSIQTDGKVGIGTTTPATLLDVQGAALAAGIATLSTAELTVVSGDILGSIYAQAPLESSGTDAILVSAAIDFVATATFAADNDSTDIVFRTGQSETATEKMRLTSGGRLGIGTASPGSILQIEFPATATDQSPIFVKPTSGEVVPMPTLPEKSLDIIIVSQFCV